MDYYGTKLATCSSDKTIKIFELQTNGQQIPIAELVGHEGPVWQLSWSHPKFGSLLASCSYDRKVIIWKEVSGKWTNIKEINCHDASVNSVSWAPPEYGIILACASSDGSLSIISSTNDETWEPKKIINAHSSGCNAVSWCPPYSLESSSAGLCTKRLISGGCDNLLKIWKENNNKDWEQELQLEGHTDWIRDVAWTQSFGLLGNTIASCSQ
ncbi:unnamed protein product, partial [Soboliphyme baturini]|uniref:Protein SEC13 homolog n=1 Tax=Soboliphyme baturini TaxID=241478 RepID=A0A183IW31_9BILA